MCLLHVLMEFSKVFEGTSTCLLVVVVLVVVRVCVDVVGVLTGRGVGRVLIGCIGDRVSIYLMGVPGLLRYRVC